MNTANKLTVLRIILIPVFMVVLLLWNKYVALAIFIIAGITDSVDGYVARHYNQITNLGKFMDPLADKLLVTSAMLIFVQWGQMPAWALMIVIAREFAVTGLRIIAASKGIIMAAGWSGKIKTATTIIAICVMLTPVADIAVSGGVTVNHICVALIIITTVISGIEYFAKNGHVLKGEA